MHSSFGADGQICNLRRPKYFGSRIKRHRASLRPAYEEAFDFTVRKTNAANAAVTIEITQSIGFRSLS